MMELQKDLKNPRVYAFMVAGTFIGIALVMAAEYFGYANLGKAKQAGQSVNTQQANLTPGTAFVVKDMLKDIDPTKPYTDANGTEHPPLGVKVVPYDPSVKVVAPPAGGPTPVAPKAPAVPALTPKPATPGPALTSTSTR